MINDNRKIQAFLIIITEEVPEPRKKLTHASITHFWHFRWMRALFSSSSWDLLKNLVTSWLGSLILVIK